MTSPSVYTEYTQVTMVVNFFFLFERRRGKALEDAVLDAGWSALLDGGYAGFTVEVVAARARTSRPVL